MSQTAQQLFNSAGRLLGICSSEEGLTAQESADTLVTFNQLLESLSLEKLTVFQLSPTQYFIGSGKQNVTIGIDPDGTTADVTAPRPLAIEDANLLIPNGGQTYRHGLRVLRDMDQLARIRLIGVPGRPNAIGLIEGYPFSTLTFDQATDTAYTLELWSQQELTAVATLATNIRFPRGYERMLRYALAIELAGEYGKAVPASVADRAQQAKMQVQSHNAPDPIVTCDPAIVRSGGNWWNYRTGGY